MNGGSQRAERDSFIANFGGTFEHSPWIAERAWDRGADSAMGLDELAERFGEVVHAAGKNRQLALLNAHPELACARADRETLTEASRGEQSGAGLDRCDAYEYTAFQMLNRRYREKFGFPFILAVSGYHRKEILKIFIARVENSPDEEFAEALRQVCKIGRLRLESLLNG